MERFRIFFSAMKIESPFFYCLTQLIFSGQFLSTHQNAQQS